MFYNLPNLPLQIYRQPNSIQQKKSIRILEKNSAYKIICTGIDLVNILFLAIYQFLFLLFLTLKIVNCDKV